MENGNENENEIKLNMFIENKNSLVSVNFYFKINKNNHFCMTNIIEKG